MFDLHALPQRIFGPLDNNFSGVVSGAHTFPGYSLIQYLQFRFRELPKMRKENRDKRFDPIITRERVIAFGLPAPRATSFDELLPFMPPNPSSEKKTHPSILIIDDFYPNPHEVRSAAFRAPYIQYLPGWWVTGLEHRPNPLKGKKGFRWNQHETKSHLEAIVGAKIRMDTWEKAGDGWNGAFHLRYREALPGAQGGIHNHYGKGARAQEYYETERGWTGVCYLSPNPPKKSGTSIWLYRPTGECFSTQETHWPEMEDCELLFYCENTFNRLIIIESRILHRAEAGFGISPTTARLTQTFFFDVE